MTDDQILETKRAWRFLNKEIRRNRQVEPDHLTADELAGLAQAMKVIIPIIGCLVMFLIAGCHSEAVAGEIPEDVAVKCVLGEARGEGPQGIKLMASALRNRGTTQGVYGCRADLSKEMAYLKARGIYQQALKAWRDSAKTDLVKGATYWGSKHVDGAWIAKMKKHGYTLTVSHRGHEFYRKDS